MFVEDYGCVLEGVAGEVVILEPGMKINDLRKNKSREYKLLYMGTYLASVTMFGNILRIEMSTLAINTEDSSYSTAVNDQMLITPIIAEAVVQGVRAMEEWVYDIDRQTTTEHFVKLTDDSKNWMLF